jgi:hypothetical protein
MSETGARPPFGNNVDQAAAQVVRDIHVHRQNHLIAATVTVNGSSILVADAFVIPSHGTLTDKTKVSITEVSADTASSAEHAHDASNPPAVPEFLLRLLATSKHREAVLGDLNERFALNCAKRGFSRARMLYWAEAAQSLLPMFGRLLGRFLKWAAVADAIRRHFLG